jgi:hypothetical protein
VSHTGGRGDCVRPNRVSTSCCSPDRGTITRSDEPVGGHQWAVSIGHRLRHNQPVEWIGGPSDAVGRGRRDGGEWVVTHAHAPLQLERQPRRRARNPAARAFVPADSGSREAPSVKSANRRRPRSRLWPLKKRLPHCPCIDKRRCRYLDRSRPPPLGPFRTKARIPLEIPLSLPIGLVPRALLQCLPVRHRRGPRSHI